MVCHLRGAQKLSSWEKLFLKRVARFIVLTKCGGQFYETQGIPKQCLQQLYNPINLTQFDVRAAAPFDLPFPFDADSVYAIQIGALKPPKRPDLAIDAVARARSQCPNLKLILAGDGSMREELEKMISDRGLRDAVYLIGFCSQVPALLSRCHIGLLVSRSDYEGLGNVILESMAARLPIVTWNSTVMTEIVHDGKTGLIAPDDSAEAISTTLVTLCRSAELRRCLGEAGRNHVESECFNPAAHIRKLDALLADVVSGGRQGVA